MDQSNGYERVAPQFIKTRGQNVHGIGASSVRKWARTLAQGSVVLDLACGTGIPISKVLVDEGLTVYGVDASASMIKAFRQNFPNAPFACEPVETSSFFNRKFDAVIAWGLIFLLAPEAQTKVIQKAANALHSGGKLLFTAPSQVHVWEDVMTNLESRSLGAEKYKQLLSAAGLLVIEEFEDEGENHYYNAVKI